VVDLGEDACVSGDPKAACAPAAKSRSQPPRSADRAVEITEVERHTKSDRPPDGKRYERGGLVAAVCGRQIFQARTTQVNSVWMIGPTPTPGERQSQVRQLVGRLRGLMDATPRGDHRPADP